MTPEGALKQACRKVAKMHGLLFENVESKSRRGWPDTVCGKHPRGTGVVLVEFKTLTGVVDPQQTIRHRELRACGLEVYVCRTVHEYEQAVGLLAGAL